MKLFAAWCAATLVFSVIGSALLVVSERPGTLVYRAVENQPSVVITIFEVALFSAMLAIAYRFKTSDTPRLNVLWLVSNAALGTIAATIVVFVSGLAATVGLCIVRARGCSLM
jgi:hypothetical protein